MIDEDTFLTILYVMVDDFCQWHDRLEPRRPGPQAGIVAQRSGHVVPVWTMGPLPQ